MNKPGKNWHRFWLGIAVFVLMPCWIIYSGWQMAAAAKLDSIRETTLTSMRKGLAQLRREGDDAFFLQRQLNFAYGMIAEEQISGKNISRHLQVLKKQGLDFINFRFFGSDRRLIAVEGESDSLRIMVQRIFEALSQPETEGDGKLLVRYRSFFDAFLGSVDPAGLVSDKSALIKVVLNGRPGYFYWNTFYDNSPAGRFLGGMISWFAEADIPGNLSIALLLKKLNAENPGSCRWGLIDLDRHDRSFPARLDEGIFAGGLPALRRDVIDMRRNFVSERVFADRLLAVEHIDARRLVYCIQRPDDHLYRSLTFLLRLLFMMAAVLLVRRAFEMFTSPGDESSGSRAGWVTAGLVFVPVVMYLLAGYMYLGLQRQLLQRQAHEQLAGQIENIDENYIVAVDSLEALYRRAAGSQVVKKMQKPGLTAMGTLMKQKDAVNRMYIVDREGRLLFGLPENRSGEDLVKKLIPTIARRIYAVRPGSEQSWQDKINDMMVESITSSFNDVLGDGAAGFLKPFENLDRISEFWFANRRYYVFSTFVNRAAGEDPLLMIIWQGTGTFSERYLMKQVRRNLATPEYEQPVRLAMVARNAEKMPYPGEFSKYPFSVQMAERVVSTETQQFSVEEAAGEGWLVVASPMKRVPDYVLFAMSPLRLIDREIAQTGVKILFSAIFCLIIAVVAGRFFAAGVLSSRSLS